MRRFLTAAVAVLMLAGCTAAPTPTLARYAVAPTLRILVLGDSIPYLGGNQDEFCRILAQDAGITCDVRNVAVGGTNCMYWPSRIAGLLATHQPDMVWLFCGTNDNPDRYIYGEPETSWAFRYTVEAIHFYRSPPIPVVPNHIQYSDPMVAPAWLLDFEPRTNDNLYREIHRRPDAIPAWFPGVADFQYIPSTATYLDDGGIHPTARGYRYMARMIYDRIYAAMGWPAPTEPALCDLYGHRRYYPRPAYTPC